MVKAFLQNILRPKLVRMQLQAATKDDAIRELVDILDQGGLLKDRAEAERVVFERERAMSTGMENGIAIPHGKTDMVNSLVVSIGLKPKGLDFQAVDGQPSRILLLTLSPPGSTGPHLRFMAEVSKILRNADVRAKLLQTQTPEQLVQLLIAAAP